MEKKITWESKHYTFDNVYNRLEKKQDFDEDCDDESHPEGQTVMNTPFGMWNVDDSMNPFKQFEFWMGHTNFSLGLNAESIMKRIPGVEVLKILTRYRFLIGVGSLFNIRDVRTNMEFLLCGTSDDNHF